jgi:hypothetical protein
MGDAMNALATALVSALTSVTVVFVSYLLSSRSESRKAAQVERQALSARYLNPLRLHLAENHFRLTEILMRTTEIGKCEDLLTIDGAADISDRELEWFTSWGAYLASSAYLTACLFAWLKKTRDSAPYLHLRNEDDTRLSVLMLRVSHSFLRDQGIYYVIQPSIGQDMILAAEDRLISYREFCELLRTPGRRVWLDRLIAYYLETGRGMKLDRVADAIAAIEALSNLLDDVAGGGESVRSRLVAEGITSL